MKILLLAMLFAVSSAEATVLVNPPLPAPQHSFTDAATYSLAFAGAPSPTPGQPLSLLSGAEVNTALGFRILNMGDLTTLVYFDVSSNATTFPPAAADGTQLAVTLSISAGGTAIPLTGAAVMNGVNQAPAACNSNGVITCLQGGTTNFITAFYTANSTLRLSFTLAQLCSVSNGSGTWCDNTSTGHAPNGELITIPITVSFSKLNPAVNTSAGLTSGSESLTLNFQLTDQPPTLAKPTGGSENFYAPGDQEILVHADNYTPSVGNGVPLQNLIVLASRSGIPAITDGRVVPPTGTEVAGYISYTGDRLEVPSGDNAYGAFVNTTTGTDNGYQVAVYAMSIAGILSNGTPVTTPFGNCAIGDCTSEGVSSADGKVRTQKINGVLTESKCFIATAAFHDGHAGPVMMLRKFRDQVLAKSALGRKFISTYYHYSPAAAMWAWDKPFVRSIALHALAPVEFMAWAILKFTHAAQVESPQPYIDRIKKKLDEDAAGEAKHQVGDSYSEQVKKSLDPRPTPSSEHYVEELKKKIPEADDPSGYSKKVKEDLPPVEDTTSTIANVKAGRDHRKPPVRPPVKTAVSFKFGVHPGLKVVNPSGVVTFDDMYGNGVAGSFQPDLVFHYERFMFHNENFGSFGLGADLGVTYAEGYGRYQFEFGSLKTKVSLTKFNFLQFPVTVNATYRFSLLRIIRPYASIGVGSLFYAELRKDMGNTLKGYSPVYQTMVGAALRLDGADPDTARDAFLSDDIQHTFFYVEYMLLKSFNQAAVNFERNGIYAGFMFEY